MADQLTDHFENIFDKLLSGFRKKHGCQTLMLKIVEDWRNALDKKQIVGAILMDLSKAFDCLPHSVLARNEEFSKIALINFFLQFSKKNTVICGGGFCGGGFCGGNFEIYHANQQFSTCMLIDTHVNKRERYTISPVHDCACYCMHTCLLMLIKIQIENTQSTLESKNISFMGVLKKL